MERSSDTASITRESSGVYLRRLLIITLLMFVPVNVYTHRFKELYMNPEYAMWQHQKHIAEGKDAAERAVVMVGDSRSMAGFEAASLDAAAINLSVGGATPIEGYALIRSYLRNNPTPDAVVVSYAPYHLTTEDSFWGRTVKFSFLEPDGYAEVYRIAKEAEPWSSFTAAGKLLRYATYFLPYRFFGDLSVGFLFTRGGAYESTYRGMEESRGQHFFGTDAGASGLNREAALDGFRASPTLDIYLRRMFEEIGQSGAKAFWYTVPFNQSSCEALDSRFEGEYAAYLAEVSAEYDVSIINDLECYADEYFGDPDHIYSGSSIVTMQIYDYVASALSRESLGD
jgi:hypothetical protein